MIYGSWDINCNRQIFFVILGHFCPFTPLTAQKMKISKKKKIPGDIIILHKCTKTHDHRLYCSWDMVRDDCNYCILFWAIFWPSTPLTAQKIKISKKKKGKKHLDIHHFTQVHQKSWLYVILFLRYDVWPM